MSETTTSPHEPTESEGMKWLSGIASLVGLWIVASPFVFEAAEAAIWNNVVVGAAIFLIAGYNWYRIRTDHPTSIGAMTLVALLAVWTLIAPFAFEIGSEALLWSNVVAGVLGGAFAGYVAYNRRRIETRRPTPTE